MLTATLLTLLLWMPTASGRPAAPPVPQTQVDTLESATVTAIKQRMRNTTQTGLTRFDGDRLRSGVVAFGIPDIIKQLQLLPGVAAGNEMMSGLYVHGGDGNDNLFLLDGVPLYNISHFGGLFSSFNTDLIDNLDFYKSGFPARYGGRLSSVVDVETREGNMESWHGSVSLGLIEGRLQAEGPIVPGRTSINVGLRRSWLELVTIPVIAYANRRNGDDRDVNGDYSMSDLNARLTHRFSPKSVLDVIFYTGLDKLSFGQTSLEHIIAEDMSLHSGESRMNSNTRWGSLTASVAHRYEYSPKLKSTAQLYYSRSHSRSAYDWSFWSWSETEGSSVTSMDDSDVSAVSEIGFKSDFDWYPDSFNHVRFGVAAQYHWYDSGRDFKSSTVQEGLTVNSDAGSESLAYRGLEPAVYIEDEIFLHYNFTANVGLRYALFATQGKTWHSLEPRVSFKWMLGRDYAVKLSYTRMSQFAHLVAAMYMDLPSNSWMPSTASARPMVSNQIAGGLYTTPLPGLTVNIEGWYKTMDHLLVYNGTNTFVPPLTEWEKSFEEGIGRSYGLEFEATWAKGPLSLSAYYTLSWTQRRFESFYPDWYPDRNDNRHKVNLVASWRFARQFELYVNWNWHSGNRVTFPSHVIRDDLRSTYVYDAPYNTKLPDYHRLDLGLDWNIKTRRGRDFKINLSIYNAYNQPNASMAMLETDADGVLVGKAYSLIPIIPTFSLSYRF